LGRQGYRVTSSSGLEVYKRDLSDGSVAVALVNRSGSSAQVGFKFTQIGMSLVSAVIRDLYLHQDIGVFSNFFSTTVNPTGVTMLKLTPVA